MFSFIMKLNNDFFMFDLQEWIFWDVHPTKPYLICIKQTVFEEDSPWASKRILPDSEYQLLD